MLSSDYCRGLVSDDENDQAATGDAFDVLHYIARKRLAAGKLTVVDATIIRPEDRKPLGNRVPIEFAQQVKKVMTDEYFGSLVTTGTEMGIGPRYG